MKNLLELFPPYRKRKEKQEKQRVDEEVLRARIKISNNLFRLWNVLVKFEDNSYLDPVSLKDLNIEYEDLTFNGDDGLYETIPNPNFFQPCKKEYLEEFPPDRDHQATRLRLEGFHKYWTDDSPQLFKRPIDASDLSDWLREWFQFVLRKRLCEDKSMSLGDLSYLKQDLML